MPICAYSLLSSAAFARQKDEVLNEETHRSFQNAVAVMPLFARSVAAELREASDQVGRHWPVLPASIWHAHAYNLPVHVIDMSTARH